MGSIKRTLKNQRDNPPSLHDKNVRQRLLQCFSLYSKDDEKLSEDLEKATRVDITEANTPSDINLLQVLPNVEKVTLKQGEFSNEDLATVLVGISVLEKLQTLIIRYCRSLTSVPPEIGQLIQLQELIITGCDSLTSVPPEIGQLIQLQTLAIFDCSSITSIPPNIGQLIQLQRLNISFCDSLTSVPPEIGQLIQLQTLEISYCDSLTSVPPEIGQLIQLQELKIDWNTLTLVSSVFVQLTNLQELEFSNCDSSAPLSPIVFQALPPQCSITTGVEIFDELKRACVMSGSMKELPDTRDNGASFKRKDIDPYFDWLRKYPTGAIKLQMLANKANQRAVPRVYLPEGAKYNDLKRMWDDMQQEDE